VGILSSRTTSLQASWWRSRGFPLGSAHGSVVQADWQVKESGWHLDDILLRLRNRQQENAFCAVSVKSNVQLNSSRISRHRV